VRSSAETRLRRSQRLPSCLRWALPKRSSSAYCSETTAPKKGSTFDAKGFSEALRAALTAAGIEGRIRAFHDLRHTAITNDAASGSNPIAVMTKAGHSDMKTTKRYLHLAGVVFRDEAERLEQRLLGDSGTRNRYQVAANPDQ
jgi:integrase